MPALAHMPSTFGMDSDWGICTNTYRWPLVLHLGRVDTLSMGSSIIG